MITIRQSIVWETEKLTAQIKINSFKLYYISSPWMHCAPSNQYKNIQIVQHVDTSNRNQFQWLHPPENDVSPIEFLNDCISNAEWNNSIFYGLSDCISFKCICLLKIEPFEFWGSALTNAECGFCAKNIYIWLHSENLHQINPIGFTEYSVWCWPLHWSDSRCIHRIMINVISMCYLYSMCCK